MQCPHCNHEVPSPKGAPTQPGYNGWLVDYVPQIEEMYKCSHSLKEIADSIEKAVKSKKGERHFGYVTSGNIKYILQRQGHSIDKTRENKPILHNGLPARAYNALKKDLGCDPTPELIFDLTFASLFRIPDMGGKSVKDVVRWLKETEQSLKGG